MSSLKVAAFTVMAVFVGFVALMVIGETLVDPGGWKAVGITAAWLGPLVLLCLMARAWPDLALPVLAVAVCVPVGFGVLQLLDYERWQAWEDRTGPVSLMLIVVVAAALAVEGLTHPAAAGALTVTIVVAPTVLAMIGAGDGWVRPLSISVLLMPVLASGVLFLLAGRKPAGASTPRQNSPRLG